MRRLRGEDGIALAVAMITIALIGILSAIFASSAVQLGDSSDTDRDTKRALGAAEAGMNTALHRIAQEPLDQHLQCYAQASVSPNVQTQVYAAQNNLTVNAGQCPPSDVGRAGNGGSYFYFVTPALKSGSCNDPVTTQTHVNTLYALGYVDVTLLQRCVTSFGTVNGVTRRVQRRVYATLQLFSGLVADDRGDDGTDDVYVHGGANVGTSTVGTNGRASMNNATYSGQLMLHRTAETSMQNVVGAWTETRRDTPWVLNAVNPGPAAATHDHSITCVGPLLDALCASAGWIHSSHTFDIRAGYTVTLSGGTYYACGFSMSGGTLEVLAPSTIYIDSPLRSGSGCAGGGFSWTGGLMNTLGAALPSNLQVHVYGAPDDRGSHAITLEGTSTDNANLSLYAPTSKVTVRRRSCGTCVGGPTVKGSVSAHGIEISGSGTTFVADPALDFTLSTDRLPTLYRPDGWLECRSQPTVTGDPESGCPS